MHVRTHQQLRKAIALVALSAASVGGVSAASASGGSGGGGGALVCVVTSTTSTPNVVGTTSIAVAPAGSVTLVTSATGLTITRAIANAGWTGKIGLASGPKVTAQFDNNAKTTRMKVEVRWAPAYYGVGNNIIEIKTCN